MCGIDVALVQMIAGGRLMNRKFRIMIVEDHGIMRESVKSLLSSGPEFEIVGEAADGYEAIERIQELKPDLVLTDLSMPKMNGIEMIEEVKRKVRDTKIIALTVHRGEEYVLATLKAGADGYVLKEDSYVELSVAIKHVLKGQRYLSPGVSGKLIEGYLDGRKPEELHSVWETLTKREREILKLIAEGYRNREIADQLYISVNTVEKHRSNIMEKLNIHNTATLIAFAVEKGLVERNY